MNDIPSLKIGNLTINPPIIQGGMGIRVSGANLAAAVANTGCAGIIASTGIGSFEEFKGDFTGYPHGWVCEKFFYRAKSGIDHPHQGNNNDEGTYHRQAYDEDLFSYLPGSIT